MKNIKSYLITGAIAIVAVMLYNKYLASLRAPELESRQNHAPEAANLVGTKGIRPLVAAVSHGCPAAVSKVGTLWARGVPPYRWRAREEQAISKSLRAKNHGAAR